MYNVLNGGNMLTNKYSKRIYNSILPVELINPYPAIDDRIFWENLNNIILRVIEVKPTAHDLKPLKGTVLLDAFQTGDTSVIETLFKEKNDALIFTSLLGCINDKSEYIIEALDMAWSVMDMALWHLPSTKTSSSKEEYIYRPVIDESAANTAGNVLYSYYLLKSRYDSFDINIGKRFEFEIRNRIIQPFFDRSDDWMQRSNGNYLPCVPGILSNVLFGIFLFEADYIKKHDAVRQSLVIIDSILENADTYNATERRELYNGLITFFDCLYMATGSAFDVFNDFPGYVLSDLAEQDNDYSSMDSISLLRHVLYTDDPDIAQQVYKDYTGEQLLQLCGSDTSMERILFLINNSDLILNKFYLKES